MNHRIDKEYESSRLEVTREYPGQIRGPWRMNIFSGAGWSVPWG